MTNFFPLLDQLVLRHVEQRRVERTFDEGKSSWHISHSEQQYNAGRGCPLCSVSVRCSHACSGGAGYRFGLVEIVLILFSFPNNREDSKVSHFIINKVSKNSEIYYRIGDQMFLDLPSLLNFYRLHYLDTTPLVKTVSTIFNWNQRINPPDWVFVGQKL